MAAQWQSPTSAFADSFSEHASKESTPRSGMTRTRREELELWREQKRQKLAIGHNTPHPTRSGITLNPPSTGSSAPSFNGRMQRHSLSSAESIERRTLSTEKPVRMAPLSDSSNRMRTSTPNLTCSSIDDTSAPRAISVRRATGLPVRSSENRENIPTPFGSSTALIGSDIVSSEIPPSQSTVIESAISTLGNENSETSASRVNSMVLESSSVDTSQSGTTVETNLESKLMEAESAKSARNEVATQTSGTPKPDPKEEYDVTLLLLANDTLVQHLAESEARRVSECGRLRQEREELRLELRMQETRFKIHAQRLEESMQQTLLASLERIQELTEELEQANATIEKLQKKCKSKKDDK